MALTSGCSTFNREWRAASKIPAATNDLAGRWQGSWVSEANGHSGKLRCLISRQREDAYAARFHAKFMKIFSFGYAVKLETKRTGDTFNFTGSADLGALGGVYRYEGHAEGTNFFSTYSSKYDHGTFQMRRL